VRVDDSGASSAFRLKIFLQRGINLLYQFWVHTETIYHQPP
jgi:hypothetical protein